MTRLSDPHDPLLQRLAFLARAGEVLASSFDFEQTLQDLARLSVPTLGDLCIVDVVDEGGLRRVATAHISSAKVALLEKLRTSYSPSAASPQPAARVLRTGEIELLPHVTPDVVASHVFDAEHAQLIRAIGIRSHLAVPLIARQTIVGVISLGVTESDRVYGDDDAALAQDLARRAALAIDNARLYQIAQDELAQRRRAEEALTFSEERFRAIVEQSPLSTQILAPSGETMRVNKAWEELWGVTLEALGGYNILQDPQLETLGIAPLLRRAFGGEAVHLPAIRYDPNETIPDRSRHADPVRWVRAFAYPVKDASGAVREVVLVHEDVTASRQSQERLQSSEEQLRTALEDLRAEDRRKDEFLATLAHELRNPLAPIRTGLTLLRENRGGEAAERTLHVMDRQLGHMVRLIDDLLDLSRVTRGHVELSRERVDLATVVASAVEASRPLLEEAGVELFVHLPGAALTVDVDRLRMSQVLSNLLNNAAKFTERGGRVDLEAFAEGADVVLRLKDTGIGIPRHMLSNIFEMFTQGSDARVRQTGLGIGLTLVRRLVELHDGQVWAESEGEGQGSTFTVRLPAAAVPARAFTPDNNTVDVPAASSARRVLVVDDNADGAEMLEAFLALDGHDVRTAFSGPEALQVLASFQPDVAFLDIGLPGMNGYELARRMRAEPSLSSILLVAVTGWGQEEDRRRSTDAGFDHHLTKPVDPADVRALVADKTPPRAR